MRPITDEERRKSQSHAPARSAGSSRALHDPAINEIGVFRDKRSENRLAGIAGWLFGRPWLDSVASWALRRWYFPLSRLWAAASIAGGSPERFFEAAPLDPLRSRRYGLQELLIRFEESRSLAEAVDAAWHRAFFEQSGIGGGAPSPVECLALERARLSSRHRYNAMRWDFRTFLRPELPRVCYKVPQPAEVDAVYGPALTESRLLFQAPDPMPQVSVSRSIPAQDGRDYWLSFKSPSTQLGDQVFARVHEPSGIENPPTIIFGHGVCVEFDHWRGLIDEASGLRGRGFRVIRPEAPWHGRRRPRGTYGGERMIATFPMGSLDLLTGAVREWAVLADWARRTSSGPLAFGGSSLGAMTAQLAADRARDWPRGARPDALLLITHCWQLDDAVKAGELMRIWGGQDIVEAQGWSEERAHAYLSLLAPGAVPALSPDRIVTILGRRDTITPFASGLKLIDRWGVPEANRFIWDRGHFSIPVTLMRSAAPFDRFCELMHEAL